MDHAPTQKTRFLKFLGELVRYGLTTVLSLLFLSGGIWVAERIGIPSTIAYPVLLTLVYIVVYLSYAHYVFGRRPDRQTLFRFLIVLVLSWLGNNLLFHISLQIFHLAYGFALLINTVVLGGFRFLLQRHFVFRKPPANLPADL